MDNTILKRAKTEITLLGEAALHRIVQSSDQPGAAFYNWLIGDRDCQRRQLDRPAPSQKHWSELDKALYAFHVLNLPEHTTPIPTTPLGAQNQQAS